MGSIWQDFRYAVRLLRKNVMFTAIAVLALALGIGANTAIFSLINALLINPLPLPELDRLVAIWEKIPSQGVDRNETAIANYLDWKAQNSTFENVSLYTWWNANLGSIDPPERVQGYLVTANFLDTIAVKPLLGRNFSAEEEQDGKDRVAIISYGLWQRRFAANPDIINQPVVINGVTRTLIGVMPEGYKLQLPDGSRGSLSLRLQSATSGKPSITWVIDHCSTETRCDDGTSASRYGWYRRTP
jgi:putative ABC transport system permease protein